MAWPSLPPVHKGNQSQQLPFPTCKLPTEGSNGEYVLISCFIHHQSRVFSPQFFQLNCYIAQCHPLSLAHGYHCPLTNHVEKAVTVSLSQIFILSLSLPQFSHHIFSIELLYSQSNAIHLSVPKGDNIPLTPSSTRKLHREGNFSLSLSLPQFSHHSFFN